MPRQEPKEFYPEGYDPETMTVIGRNTHEYLEIEGLKVSVRVEREAICKPKGAKPTDITDKYCHHIPEYRQVKRFEAMGLRLSTTSINRWQHDLADKLYPIYEQ